MGWSAPLPVQAPDDAVQSIDRHRALHVRLSEGQRIDMRERQEFESRCYPQEGLEGDPALPHVLPKGFHRIRHYGLLASAGCKANIARARKLMAAPMAQVEPLAAHDTADPDATPGHRPPCPCCGGRMIIVEVFACDGAPRGPPPSGTGIRI
jgi:hypothetical protein